MTFPSHTPRLNRKQRRRTVKGRTEAEIERPQTAHTQAQALQPAGKTAEAEVAYRAALAVKPNDVAALYNLGVIALERQDAAEAVDFFGHAALADRVEAHVGRAMALCQCGRLEEAVTACQAALVLQPNRPEIHSNLGVVLRDLGRSEEAVLACRSAIVLRPDYAEAYSNLGSNLIDLGRPKDAVHVLHAARTLHPDSAIIHNNLGAALNSLGRYDEAIDSCRRALEIRNNYVEAYNNLGNALLEQGRTALASDVFRLALALRPVYPEIHNNLSVALKDLGRIDEAEAAARTALAQRPGYPEAHNNLAIALTDLGRLEEAEAECRAALALKSPYPSAHSNLGNVLFELGRLEEALVCYRTALAQRADHAEAHNNLGITLKAMGRLPEAIAACRAAIALRPDYAGAHRNLALSLLLNGEFSEGWQEYEWRGKNRSGRPLRHPYSQPQWQGEPLEGRTLLLWPEEGHGDQLQFCRYARLAAARGGRVLLATYRPLTRLLASVPGVAQVVPNDAPLPPFDCHLPLLSMPHIVGTTADSIPAKIPYLRVDPVQSALWGERLRDLPGLKVGLVWAGDPRPHDHKAHAIDRRRSINPLRLLPLLSVPGVSMVSLQMGTGAAARETLPEALRPRDVMAGVGDFADTAAIVTNLDLVISVDTSMVHLAGALGKPVWVLSRYDGCWRWLLERDDSPWYPTLRLFRQPAPDAWETVVAEIATELAALARPKLP
jgi:Flp pilus assembly protein TadD